MLIFTIHIFLRGRSSERKVLCCCCCSNCVVAVQLIYWLQVLLEFSCKLVKDRKGVLRCLSIRTQYSRSQLLVTEVFVTVLATSILCPYELRYTPAKYRF